MVHYKEMTDSSQIPSHTQAPHFCPDQGCGDGRQGLGTTSCGLSVPVTRVGTAAGLPAGHRLLGWFGSPCPPMLGRTQWGEGSHHTRSSPPVGLPKGGDLTETRSHVPGSCGCYSCPGESLALLWGKPCPGGPCPAARELAISSCARISPDPGFHPNAALRGMHGEWGGAAPFRGPWTHQKGPLPVTLSRASGCQALLVFLGLTLQGPFQSGHLPPKKPTKPLNFRTTELLPAHGSPHPRYPGAPRGTAILPLCPSFSLSLRDPLGRRPAWAHPLPCCRV